MKVTWTLFVEVGGSFVSASAARSSARHIYCHVINYIVGSRRQHTFLSGGMASLAHTGDRAVPAVRICSGFGHWDTAVKGHQRIILKNWILCIYSLNTRKLNLPFCEWLDKADGFYILSNPGKGWADQVSSESARVELGRVCTEPPLPLGHLHGGGYSSVGV